MDQRRQRKMKNYVIDTSVAVKWFIIQPYHEKAIEILDTFKQNKCILNVPSTIYLEFTNVLWKYRTVFKVEEINSILTKFFSLDLMVHEHSHLLKGALDIAIKYNRSVYDSIFIYLAKEIEAEFITSDEKLVNSVSQELGFVKLLNELNI